MNAGESPRGGLDSTERLEAHLRSTPLAAIEFDLERRARRWNPAAERIFGYSHEEVRDVDCFPLLVPSELGSEVDQIWQQLVAGRGGGANTNLNRTKDGRTILCRWYNTPLRDERGEVVAVASLAEDITERAAAEREVRESRSRLAAVVGHLPVLVWALDASGEVTFWNDFAASTSGYSREALRGTEGGCGGLTGRRGSLHAGPEGTGRDYDRWELPLECADGQFRRIMWSGLAERCPIPGWASWGVGIDVTDARDAEEALRRSERRFREVLETIELAGVILDRDQRVLYCNEFMERLTGLPRDQIVGTDWVETFTEPDRRAEVSRDMREAFEGRAFTRRVDGAIRSVDGSKRIVSWNRAVIRDSVGRVTAATALGLDVTDARQAERELSKYRAELERLVHERTEALDESRRRLEAAERLAALGELAAGIGHDLGNMIFPLRCRLDSLVDRLGCSDPDLAALATGIDLLDRLGGSLRLLTRERERGARLARTDLSSWYAATAPLIESLVPEAIWLEVEIADGLSAVGVESHRLTQAVMNLVVNAAEAIQALGEGAVVDRRIRVIAREGLDDEVGGAVVELVVEDSGAGMPDAVRRRALEPFFTTKHRAISTGLGLAVVHGVARNAGGRVEISDREGGGTRISVLLPAVDEASLRPGEAVTLRLDLHDARARALHRAIAEALGFWVVEAGEPADVAVSDSEPIAGAETVAELRAGYAQLQRERALCKGR